MRPDVLGHLGWPVVPACSCLVHVCCLLSSGGKLRETHLMVGVVLGVWGPRSRLRWLCTGLCAGGISGLRAGSFREKSDTALCTAREKEKGIQFFRAGRQLRLPPDISSCLPSSLSLPPIIL